MKKHIKLYIFVVFILTVITTAYLLRNMLFLQPLLKYVNNSISYNISADNMHILPYKSGIAFYNVSIDGKLKTEKLFIKISPFNSLKDIKNPLSYIRKVSFNNLIVNIDDNAVNKLSSISKDNYNSANFDLPKSEIDFFADSITIIKDNTELLKVYDSGLYISYNKISIFSSIFAFNSPISIVSDINRKENNLFDVFTFITSSGDFDSHINIYGDLDLENLNYNQTVKIYKLSYKNFVFDNSSGSAVKTSESFEAALNGDFGTIAVKSTDSINYQSLGNLNLSNINKDYSGNITFQSNHTIDQTNAVLDIENLSAFGFNLGNYSVDCNKSIDDTYKFIFQYSKNNKILFNYFPNGNYETKVIISNRQTGSFNGNFVRGTLFANMSNVSIADLPVIPFLSSDARGMLSIQGALYENYGKVNLSLTNLKSKLINTTNIYGSVDKKGDIYIVDLKKSDRSILFNSSLRKMNIIYTDFTFLNTNIANVLKAFGYTKNDITGMASGRIKYENEKTTEFEINVSSGSFYGNRFDELEAKGDLNFKRISIERFTMTGKENNVEVSASGLLGFTKENPNSFFDIKAKNIKIKDIPVSGDIIFNGNIEKDKIVGLIDAKNIIIAGVEFSKANANTEIYSDKINIYDITTSNGLTGNLKTDYSNKTLYGKLNFKNTNLKGFLGNVEGTLNSSIMLSGSYKNPIITGSLSIKNGFISTLPFIINAEFEYVESRLKIANAAIRSDKAKISIAGNYSDLPEDVLDVKFSNLTEAVINNFIGFTGPLSGNFSGEGYIKKHLNKPQINLFIKGANTSFKSLKVDEAQSNIEIYDKTISVSSGSLKTAYNQIRIEKGIFNVKSGKYNLDLFLVNAHLGPTDLFGQISIDGVMSKRKDGSVYNGTINFTNLWINRYRLSKSSFKYFMQNKTLTLSSADNVLFDAKGTLKFEESLEIKNLIINKNNSSFEADATFDTSNMDLTLKGINVNGEFISEALDLPVDINGDMSFDLFFLGDIKNPQARLRVHSERGTIAEIPYDVFDLELLLDKNKASINKAVVYKRNEIDITLTGFFPLWFDSSLDKEMQNAKLEIDYDIEDSKMNITKYLSAGFVKPISGKIVFKGVLKGTRQNITNTGQLNINNGSFELQNYIDKVKELNVDLTLTDNFIDINRFSFKSGSGKVNITGSVLLNGYEIENFDINAKTESKGINVKIKELPIPSFIGSRAILQDYSTGEPRFDIKIEGSSKKPKISGWVILENSRFTYPGVSSSNDGSSFDLPDELEFDLELKTGKNTKFENTIVDAWINGNLTIKGTYGEPLYQSVIESNRGNASYLGITFDITRAKLEIINNDLIFLSGEGETVVYTAGKGEAETMGVIITRSEIENLNMRFYSKEDPSLDSQAALAKITGTEQTTTGDENQLVGLSDFALRQQAFRLFDTSFVTPFTRTVLRKTGLIDNFRVSYLPQEPNITEPEESSLTNLLYGSKYSFEKNLTNQILLGYSLTFDQIDSKIDLRHEIEMRYRLSNTLFLSGSYELESETQLHQPDRKLMLQHQIRFGSPSKRNK